MKKGTSVLVLIFAFALCMVIGIFIGRNSRDDYYKLPQNSTSDTHTSQETITDYRLDINTASKTQLMDLPGIGELTAERIIEYRTINGPFLSTDDLLQVEGIGEKKLLQIETFIRVGG